MNKDIKKENRKALPKFIGMMLICGIAGGIIGLISGFMGGSYASEEIAEKFYNFLNLVNPYVYVILTVAFIFAELRFYKGAKGLYILWNGEDEEVIDTAEAKLSLLIVLTSVHTVLSFFLFGINHIVNTSSNTGSVIVLVLFIINLVFIMLFQQKAVDLEKSINPEKKGSIYDMNFHKKWIDSCDENEMRQIGQASYKAFIVMNITCIVLWLAVFFAGYFIHTGLLPIVCITVIWLVSQITYGVESIRLSRHSDL